MLIKTVNITKYVRKTISTSINLLYVNIKLNDQVKKALIKKIGTIKYVKYVSILDLISNFCITINFSFILKLQLVQLLIKMLLLLLLVTIMLQITLSLHMFHIEIQSF